MEPLTFLLVQLAGFRGHSLENPLLCAVLLSRVLKAVLPGDLVFSIFSNLKDTRPAFQTFVGGC